MKSKLGKILFVTYVSDNTKSPIMVFDDSLTDSEIQKLIFDYLRDDETLECYSDKELKNASKQIIQDTWYDGESEYYIETASIYYSE